MSLLRRLGLPTPDTSTPRINTSQIEATRTSWWQIYSSLISYAFDDAEDVLRATDVAYAQRIAKAASNRADAQIEEYESRWGL